MENDRTLEIIGQIKGLLWELSMTSMQAEVVGYYDELEKCQKELGDIIKSYKNQYKRMKLE